MELARRWVLMTVKVKELTMDFLLVPLRVAQILVQLWAVDLVSLLAPLWLVCLWVFGLDLILVYLLVFGLDWTLCLWANKSYHRIPPFRTHPCRILPFHIHPSLRIHLCRMLPCRTRPCCIHSSYRSHRQCHGHIHTKTFLFWNIAFLFLSLSMLRRWRRFSDACFCNCANLPLLNHMARVYVVLGLQMSRRLVKPAKIGTGTQE
mmetsp:Transcript_8052/g.16992  ORF Transcript_8052/g.16992 Transcript_8052/m.16992 type:complete len:205 (-) Transcript_8052:35-649(-)